MESAGPKPLTSPTSAFIFARCIRCLSVRGLWTLSGLLLTILTPFAIYIVRFATDFFTSPNKKDLKIAIIACFNVVIVSYSGDFTTEIFASILPIGRIRLSGLFSPVEYLFYILQSLPAKGLEPARLNFPPHNKHRRNSLYRLQLQRNNKPGEAGDTPPANGSGHGNRISDKCSPSRYRR